MDSGGSRRCAREEGAPGCAPSGGGGDKAPLGELEYYRILCSGKSVFVNTKM